MLVALHVYWAASRGCTDWNVRLLTVCLAPLCTETILTPSLSTTSSVDIWLGDCCSHVMVGGGRPSATQENTTIAFCSTICVSGPSVTFGATANVEENTFKNVH